MTARIITLLLIVILVAIAAQLSKHSPLNRDHERLLRHLRPVGERPSQRTNLFNDVTTSISRELALLLIDQPPARYLLTISTNASVVTALLVVVSTLITPTIAPFLAAAVAWFLMVAMQRLLLFTKAQQAADALRNDMPLLLSELQTSLERGNSLTSAVIATARSTQTVWRDQLERSAASLTRGEPLSRVLADLAHNVSDPDVQRALELLALSNQHQVAQQLVAQLLTKAKLDHHHRLIATAGKREQLIWIPVALATLIPGVLLVIVPLIGSLKMLALHP
ncbi:type II secretion system F family protein [Ferrimicrobium acidiphilum]|uniref:Bacterial type II secretion system protein F domain protein n=1 Tax=Ferrimicrobium acidiphilum DSM 19497 TaxID=1121877 RepID=A0A0D8FS75_9ACTN|nr:hypothetical protein [Ferrimicrobium acidiphilum]KJE75981.1 hypothetical protein FEAC_22780 [Ferrimicrobium acidiphilum DSM 19497]MCL5052882.1 hypothetical protein [Gammaproteobacteria bacterium]